MTGFADEAGDAIEVQIRATKALGWENIESRTVKVEGFDRGNIHDIPDAAFDRLAGILSDAGVKINCFGSAIANWGKKIDDPFDVTLPEIRRAIPRMKRLGTKLVRIMSYAVRDSDDESTPFMWHIATPPNPVPPNTLFSIPDAATLRAARAWASPSSSISSSAIAGGSTSPALRAAGLA